MDDLRLSDPPMLRLWHELQEMNPDFDRRGSKNSFLPNSTSAGLVTLATETGLIGSSIAIAAPAVATPAENTANARTGSLNVASPVVAGKKASPRRLVSTPSSWTPN
jgi:hypothetical protein